MRAFVWGTGILLVASVLVGPAAFGKGPVDRITVRGPGLDQPVEINEPEVLGQFNPWAGQFLGEVLDGRPAVQGTTEPYQVFFELSDQEGDLQVIYAFSYYPGEGDHPGYIRLPGPGDKWYRTNIGTIIRGSDGSWHEASHPWGGVMSDRLGASVGSPEPRSAGARSMGWSRSLIIGAVAGLVGLLGISTARFRSRPELADADVSGISRSG